MKNNSGYYMSIFCFSCKNAFDDIEDGWICMKCSSLIADSDSLTTGCPSKYCKCVGFKKTIIPGIFRKNLFFIGSFIVIIFIITYLSLFFYYKHLP